MSYRIQKLLTAELRKLLPPLYTNEKLKSLDEVPIIVKFFHPYGGGTWWVAEFDGEDTMFGAVDLYGHGPDAAEWGYMSLAEMTELRAVIGGRRMPFQAIERDEHFRPGTTWAEVNGKIKKPSPNPSPEEIEAIRQFEETPVSEPAEIATWGDEPDPDLPF